MVSVNDVPARHLIEKTSEELKKDAKFKPPAWSEFVKTGVHAEKAPQDPEWWHTRVASVFRRVYLDGPVGVERLRTYFGGRYERGLRPSVQRKGSGKITRSILQQLESAGFLEKAEKSGRRVSNKGKSYLDRIATKIAKENPQPSVIEKIKKAAKK